MRLHRTDKAVTHASRIVGMTEDGMAKMTTSTLETYHKEMWNARIKDMDIAIQRRIDETKWGKPCPRITWSLFVDLGSKICSKDMTEAEAIKTLANLGLRVKVSEIGPLEACDIFQD